MTEEEYDMLVLLEDEQTCKKCEECFLYRRHVSKEEEEGHSCNGTSEEDYFLLFHGGECEDRDPVPDHVLAWEKRLEKK